MCVGAERLRERGSEIRRETQNEESEGLKERMRKRHKCEKERQREIY